MYIALTGTGLDLVMAVIWALVALASGIMLHSKHCMNPIECGSLAVVSLLSFSQAFAIWRLDMIALDTLLLTLGAIFVYFMARHYDRQSRQQRKDRNHARTH